MPLTNQLIFSDEVSVGSMLPKPLSLSSSGEGSYSNLYHSPSKLHLIPNNGSRLLYKHHYNSSAVKNLFYSVPILELVF